MTYVNVTSDCYPGPSPTRRRQVTPGPIFSTWGLLKQPILRTKTISFSLQLSLPFGSGQVGALLGVIARTVLRHHDNYSTFWNLGREALGTSHLSGPQCRSYCTNSS